mmetsp:Transcript_28093/g.89430  ORF Transcript_28093/g.89430 Transcript_28093/m.89430 type:complete len:270 (-) Transcript_28093:873-1682(-)
MCVVRGCSRLTTITTVPGRARLSAMAPTESFGCTREPDAAELFSAIAIAIARALVFIKPHIVGQDIHRLDSSLLHLIDLGEDFLARVACASAGPLVATEVLAPAALVHWVAPREALVAQGAALREKEGHVLWGSVVTHHGLAGLPRHLHVASIVQWRPVHSKPHRPLAFTLEGTHAKVARAKPAAMHVAEVVSHLCGGVDVATEFAERVPRPPAIGAPQQLVARHPCKRRRQIGRFDIGSAHQHRPRGSSERLVGRVVGLVLDQHRPLA